MSNVTATISTMNVGVTVRSVPGGDDAGPLGGKVPAIASTAMIGRNRPMTIAMASATLYHVVLPLKPAKALPLLAAELVNAYSSYGVNDRAVRHRRRRGRRRHADNE
jgi:hypothetical protein